MGLEPGVRLGPYEVVSPLGAGGMGEVYRARDTRIGRDVAVKILPPGLSQDADRLRRFEQEARAAGQLNHPNILVLYDVGNHGHAPYVVTELLEGQTLRERLGAAALHVRKSIEFGVQIARGLAAAHEKGIVHRDLKPENVFVTKDGQAKILDFGLAKLTYPELGPLGPRQDSEVQTATRGTDPGTVLGTVGYMSPEQVRGRSVDHRSDIFALGAILYEMLSGRRAFARDTSVETLNAILKEEPPDLTATNTLLPPAVERIVRHCLEKNPDERFASARDLAFDLQAVSETSSELRPVAPERRRRVLTAGLALVVAWLATGGGAFVLGRRTATPPLPSFRPLTFRRGAVWNARFAPDGQSFYYNAQGGDNWMAYAASLDSPEPRVLEPGGDVVGTAAGEVALIARDTASSTLVRVPVGGGAPREVARDVLAADWARNGEFALVRERGGRQRLEFPPGRVLYETPSRISQVRVSYDAAYVALVEQLRGYSDALLRVVDASGAHVLTSSPWGRIDSVAWSSDGREVWLSADRQA
ncbi:MAG TPA: serine/threonine-protein kinase, partial [Vicinamibacteria bacterium]|nr:serine/threonine-protein kinase [Vicinamibacteria bacterium]